MEQVRQLGRMIQARWDAAGRDEAALPAIAIQALDELPPDGELAWSALRFACLEGELPAQADPDSDFGQPALTLFQGEGFYVDLLFWTEGSTAIHQHAFSGAFRVLLGDSLHAEHRFVPERRASSRLAIGAIERGRVELLRPGDARPIRGAGRAAHVLLHLSRPSVTVVVRTPADPDAQPQYTLRPPGLAVDPFYRPEWLRKKVQILRLLEKLPGQRLGDLLGALLERADPHTCFAALDSVAPRLSPEQIAPHLERVRKRHGRIGQAIAEAVVEQRRLEPLLQLAGRVRQPEHHLLVGLLRVGAGRARILELIAEARPGTNPAELAVRWIGELAAAPATAPGAPNLLGLSLDEPLLDLLLALVRGATPDQAIAALDADYEAEDVAAQRETLLALCEWMRGSAILGRLIAE